MPGYDYTSPEYYADYKVKNYQKNILEQDTSNFFIRAAFDDIIFNILWTDTQETKFGTRFHIFGNIKDAPHTLIQISTPAHIAR